MRHRERSADRRLDKSGTETLVQLYADVTDLDPYEDLAENRKSTEEKIPVRWILVGNYWTTPLALTVRKKAHVTAPLRWYFGRFSGNPKTIVWLYGQSSIEWIQTLRSKLTEETWRSSDSVGTIAAFQWRKALWVKPLSWSRSPTPTKVTHSIEHDIIQQQ